jgi:hypothetical protein
MSQSLLIIDLTTILLEYSKYEALGVLEYDLAERVYLSLMNVA